MESAVFGPIPSTCCSASGVASTSAWRVEKPAASSRPAVRGPIPGTVVRSSGALKIGRRGGLAESVLKHAGEGAGDLVLDVGFTLDVDAAADELGGEADVLAALADRERELLVFDDDVEVGLRADVVHGNAGDLGRRQGALGEGDEIVAVLDDVDLLAAQLADDRLHAGALHADAGTDRIDVALAAVDGDLGALAGRADGGLDHDGAVVDLGHFHLEQLDEQSRDRSARG